MKEKISTKLYKFAYFLELVLAIFIAIGVIIGLVGIIKYIYEIYRSDTSMSYDIFKQFLSYVLILVVGIEFILMLLTHSIESTAKLVIFLITRKMLIYGSNMKDMLLGSLALAIVFAILKYLIYRQEENDTNKEKSLSSL